MVKEFLPKSKRVGMNIMSAEAARAKNCSLQILHKGTG